MFSLWSLWDAQCPYQTYQHNFRCVHTLLSELWALWSPDKKCHFLLVIMAILVSMRSIIAPFTLHWCMYTFLEVWWTWSWRCGGHGPGGVVDMVLEVWWTWSWRCGGHGPGGVVDMAVTNRSWLKFSFFLSFILFSHWYPKMYTNENT